MNQINLYNGNCLEKLKAMPDNSIDSIVTDPPYGLSFMGKKWDYDVPSIEIWKECFRVLKHGGHLLSFGGTRTYHRLVVNIEDAGFEIRDCIQWLYGSGFPKSTDVSKRIDKEAGAEREVVGKSVRVDGRIPANEKPVQLFKGNSMCEADTSNANNFVTAPSTDSAKQWQGWGTALKPANEPICVARKPLEKGLTVAENVLKYGTGAINIDGCRIELGSGKRGNPCKADGSVMRTSQNAYGEHKDSAGFDLTQGRWPANIIIDEVAAEMLDEQSGVLKSGKLSPHHVIKERENKSKGFEYQRERDQDFGGDSGGASRFFYVAKASKSERNKGLDKPSSHPTVKPIKLMQYLIKLVTPPNGTVLDPFMGSGSTGVAAKKLGFNFVGCEMSEEYFEIAKKRIESNEPQDK